MSRTRKDQPHHLGGNKHPHVLANTRGWPLHKRSSRRRARAKAKDALRAGNEPNSRYPVEHEYYD